MIHIKRMAVLLLALSAVVCLSSFTAARVVSPQVADGGPSLLVDDRWGGTLSETDLATLASDFEALRPTLGESDILVVFTSNWESDAKRELERNGYDSREKDVIGLVVWYNGMRHETELYTYGDMTRYISDEALESLQGRVAPYLTRKDYAGAIACFMEGAARAYASGVESAPTAAERWGTAALVGVCLGAVLGGVAILIVAQRYRRKNRSPSYPLSQFADLHLTIERDIFLYHTVVKTPISTGSSSGGRIGGGGGRSGGGRSSGRR